MFLAMFSLMSTLLTPAHAGWPSLTTRGRATMR
jgi:hypothetical protein